MTRPGSYVVVDKRTGNAVYEFYEEATKKHINTDKYTIMTAAEYLPTLNKKKGDL